MMMKDVDDASGGIHLAMRSDVVLLEWTLLTDCEEKIPIIVMCH